MHACAHTDTFTHTDLHSETLTHRHTHTHTHTHIELMSHYVRCLCVFVWVTDRMFPHVCMWCWWVEKGKRSPINNSDGVTMGIQLQPETGMATKLSLSLSLALSLSLSLSPSLYLTLTCSLSLAHSFSVFLTPFSLCNCLFFLLGKRISFTLREGIKPHTHTHTSWASSML